MSLFQLPRELITEICSFSDPADLYALLQTCKSLHNIVVPLLYVSVALSTPKNAIRKARTILGQPLAASAVREFLGFVIFFLTSIFLTHPSLVL
jgi:hypothetical protein